MASKIPLKVVEVCQVTPSYESQYSAVDVSLPLTFFDILWLKLGPVERIFYYELPDLTPTLFSIEILPKLKNSLSLALLRFLPLAGNVTWPSQSAKPIILYTPKDGVSLTVAESNNAADFDDLSGNEMHDALLSRPYVPRLAASDEKAPVLALQITLFPNRGFSIGCAAHHAALDGKSSTLFMKAWAHLCKHSSCLLPAELIPFFDRTVVQDPEGIDIEYLNNWSSMDQADGGSDSKARCLKPFPPREVEPNSARATFIFSREDIKKLRERILSQLDKVSDRKDAEPIHLSCFAITLSYALACLVKARGLKGDEKMMFGIPADCRARLDPPIPTNYSGNCISFRVGVLIAGSVMQDDGILFVARKVSELIKGIEKTTLEVEKDRVKKLTMTTDLDAIPVGVAGSSRFEVYGVDFGWGRPKNVEVTSIERSGAISMAESKAESGGVEIGLVLKKDVMGIFENLFVNGLKHV